MPTVVEVAYNVSSNGSPPWRIPSNLITQVQDRPFVKLRPWDAAFVKLVLYQSLDLPKGQDYPRPSLASCEGFRALIQLRNNAVAEQKKVAAPQEECLFGSQGVASKKKKDLS